MSVQKISGVGHTYHKTAGPVLPVHAAEGLTKAFELMKIPNCIIEMRGEDCYVTCDESELPPISLAVEMTCVKAGLTCEVIG